MLDITLAEPSCCLKCQQPRTGQLWLCIAVRVSGVRLTPATPHGSAAMTGTCSLRAGASNAGVPKNQPAQRKGTTPGTVTSALRASEERGA